MKKFEPAVFIPAAVLIFAGVGYAVLAGDQAETLFVHLRMMITEKAEIGRASCRERVSQVV